MRGTQTSVIVWSECVHNWEERESMYSNEYHTEVKCTLCGCYGEKNNSTEEVIWPTT